MRFKQPTKVFLNRRTVADIQGKLVKWDKRSAVSRRFHAKNNKKTIATWKLDLDKILQVFTVRSIVWGRDRS